MNIINSYKQPKLLSFPKTMTRGTEQEPQQQKGSNKTGHKNMHVFFFSRKKVFSMFSLVVM